MKHKFLPVILAALMLTACAADNPPADEEISQPAGISNNINLDNIDLSKFSSDVILLGADDVYMSNERIVYNEKEMRSWIVYTPEQLALLPESSRVSGETAEKYPLGEYVYLIRETGASKSGITPAALAIDNTDPHIDFALTADGTVIASEEMDGVRLFAAVPSKYLDSSLSYRKDWKIPE